MLFQGYKCVGCPVAGASCSYLAEKATNHQISKRMVRFPVMAATFGLSAIGMGLYTYLSRSNLKQHQEAIEAHLRMAESKISSQDTYTEMSAGLYQKNYLRSMLLEQNLQKALCSLQKGEEDHIISLLLS